MYDLPLNANKADKAEIKTGNMVKVIEQVLEMRLSAGEYDDESDLEADLEAAIRASMTDTGGVGGVDRSPDAPGLVNLGSSCYLSAW